MSHSEIFAALNRHDIRYVLFGTLGAIAHGANLSTIDVDICPELSPENLERIKALLEEINAKPKFSPGWNTQEECDSWQAQPITIENYDHLFDTSLGELDICPFPYGARGKENRHNFESLDANAVTLRAFGQQIRVADLEELIASKMSAQRKKDLAALQELQRLQREKLS